ncbi:hypothetical protein ACHAXT_007781 [Thalassiosira profunda]
MNTGYKRRAPAGRTMAAALFAAALATSSVAAFTATDTTSIRFSSITIANPRARVSTMLLAAESTPEQKKSPMDLITDENRHELLHPPADPDRPVLVDAFAPWCGPCKILDKVLRKAQPRYADKVNFIRWNVNDKEGTAELKTLFLDGGYTLTKLPSLIVFREGKPVAVRPGLANEFQLDDFLEKTLPDVLERTFDEDGVKLLPLPEQMMLQQEEEAKKKAAMESKPVDGLNKKEDLIAEMAKAIAPAIEEALEEEDQDIKCNDPQECLELLFEQTMWENRTVVPAMDGVLLPARTVSRP